MSTETLGVALDIALIVLLAAAFVYGFMLNRRISSLHQSRKELASLFHNFDNTILKAQKSVQELKQASLDASKNLQVQIDEANVLLNDLSYINDRAAGIADKLEYKIQANRGLERDASPMRPEVQQHASKPAQKSVTANHQVPEKKSTGMTNASTLEMLLERINNRIDNNSQAKHQEAERTTSKHSYATPERKQPSAEGISERDRTRAENVLRALSLRQKVS